MYVKSHRDLEYYQNKVKSLDNVKLLMNHQLRRTILLLTNVELLSSAAVMNHWYSCR